jgi:hypothetical protein
MLLAILAFVAAAQLLHPPVAAGWEISQFEVKMTIRPDARVRVVETLRVSFGPERHRGIYRTLPLSVVDRTGARHDFDLRLLAVTDGEGRPRPTRVWRSGANLEIWLGQSQTFITGRQVYILTYEVDGAILRGTTWDEFRWNVTGRPWEVKIIEAMATVELPPGASTEEVDGASYVSKFGQLGRQADWKVMDGSRAEFVVRRGLVEFEEFTISVAWPAGLVAHPGRIARIGRLLLRQPILLLPLLVLLGVIWSVGRRRRPRPGFDPFRRVIFDQERPSPPAGLTPAEVGMTCDERAEPAPADLVATILDLAGRGLVKIEFKDGGQGVPEILLRRSVAGETAPDLKAPDLKAPDLKAHEKVLFDALFRPGSEASGEDGPATEATVSVDELSWRLHPHLAAAGRGLEEALVSAGNLDRSPYDFRSRTVRWTLLVLGAGLLGGYLWAKLVGEIFPHAWVPIAIGSLLAAAIVLCAGWMTSRRTATGTSLLAWARGFEDYARTLDPQRLEASPRQQQFEALLPYAVALGIGGQWARIFRGRVERPQWWLASGVEGFRSERIDQDLRAAARALAAAVLRAPRTTGGRQRWLKGSDLGAGSGDL